MVMYQKQVGMRIIRSSTRKSLALRMALVPDPCGIEMVAILFHGCIAYSVLFVLLFRLIIVFNLQKCFLFLSSSLLSVMAAW